MHPPTWPNFDRLDRKKVYSRTDCSSRTTCYEGVSCSVWAETGCRGVMAQTVARRAVVTFSKRDRERDDLMLLFPTLRRRSGSGSDRLCFGFRRAPQQCGWSFVFVLRDHCRRAAADGTRAHEDAPLASIHFITSHSPRCPATRMPSSLLDHLH